MINKIICNNDNFVDRVKFVGKPFEDKEYLFSRKYNPVLLSSREICQCARLLFCKKMHANRISLKDKTRIIMDNFIKNTWINLLSENENFILIDKDVYLNDISINLSCLIDAIIRIGSEPFVFLFRYLGRKEFERAKNKGVIKKDIIDMTSCLHLANLHNGILIYHHNNFLVYHIKISRDITNAIINRCKRISSFLLKNEIPKKCIGFDKKNCNKKCV